jgi:hypothetical protein
MVEMQIDKFTEKTRIEGIKQQLADLTEKEKELLFPELLNSIQGWRQWTPNSATFLSWVEWKFKQAGISIPSELFEINPVNQSKRKRQR